MKFHQLSIGNGFQYGNDTHGQTGQQRVIPRSAQITPAGAGPAVAASNEQEGTTTRSAETVLAALDDYHCAYTMGLSIRWTRIN